MTTPANHSIVSVLRHTLSRDELNALFRLALAPPSDERGQLAPPDLSRALALLELGADPNFSLGPYKCQALPHAVASSDPLSLELTLALLRSGARLNHDPDSPASDAAIHAWAHACASDSPPPFEAEQKLIALAHAGADLDAPDEYGHTPLGLLCVNIFDGERDEQQARLARRLLSLGAQPDAPAFHGATPFELAAGDANECGSGGLAVLRELLSFGARVDEATLSRCQRGRPEPAFTLFIQSIRDRLALDASVESPTSSPSKPAPRRGPL